MDFLAKITLLMKEKGLNRHTLSEACGIPYTTIDGWFKKGYEGIKISTLMKLADFFDVELDYLVKPSALAENEPSGTEEGSSLMFGSILKQLRKARKLTQDEIADMLYITKRTYASWERNEREPGFDTLCKLADYFNVSTDYLLGRVPMAVEAKKETPPESPEGVQKIKTAATIPAEHAQLIAALEAFVRRIVHEELQRRDSTSYSHP